MIMTVDPSIPRCPSCHMFFDKGRKRRLIDTCGHERCYSCIFNSDRCPTCSLEGYLGSNIESHPYEEMVSQPPASARPRLKTNGHFTTFMQTRGDTGKSNLAGVHPCHGISMTYVRNFEGPRIPWHKQHNGQTFNVNADVHRPLSGDENPAYAVKESENTAKKDLFIRFGLLPGDSPHASRKVPPPESTNHSSHESYASVSSLASSEANIACSTDTSPASTLTGSSEAEGLNSLTGYRTRGRDPSYDSFGSLMSTSNSTSPITLGPNSSQQFCKKARDCGIFARKNSPVRRFDTINNSLTGEDTQGLNHGYKGTIINLQPLFFEVPQSDPDPIFIGRHWLLKEIEQMLNLESGGIVISGGPGSGKTAIALQLVDHSIFGPKKDEHIYHDIIFSDSNDYMSVSSGGGSYLYQSRLNLTQEIAHVLGGHVVAYHFCQVDNNVTCLVPDFVHSIAAQLCQAPQLVAYRELLIQEPRYQQMLSVASCVTNATSAFVHGILEPLNTLRKFGKIPNTTCLLVIDGLNEAEFHKPDFGDTIASFLAKHINYFPSWLKVIVTVRTAFQEVTKLLPFQRISLDKLGGNDNLKRDVYDYVLYRLGSSSSIRENITINKGQGEAASHTRFANHLMSLSKGCMLYLKLTLDLIENGHLVVKSSSYNVVPVSLSEVYLLSFNLKFTTIKAYERVRPLLQVVLASLCPLSPFQLFNIVNAGFIDQAYTWDDFCQRLDILITNNFLVRRQDQCLMFSHPALREWLQKRGESESPKFLCDIKNGHAMISFRLCRFEAPVTSELCLELGHHMLMAHVYKSIDKEYLEQVIAPRDLQAYWIQQSTEDVTAALTSLRNVYSPNVKVSRLLLLAGASPHGKTDQMGNGPLLVVAAYEGIVEMVAMLLEFGANPSVVNDFGQSSLCLASQRGHLEIIRLLLTRGAKLNQTDKDGKCSLVYAASHGHLRVVCYLVQCQWPVDNEGGPGLVQAAQQSLVAAAYYGHTVVCEYLLDLPEVKINMPDDGMGYTALTAACVGGHKEVCNLLFRRGAIVSISNRQGEPPLACAVVEGHWEIAELLLSHKADLEQADSNGRTALMLAAREGHLGLLELLLAKGAQPENKDKDNLTALSWACYKGQLQATQCLLNYGADINHADTNGRTPLDLAASNGNPNIIKLLMDQGAVVEHVDLTGMRPLDRAIGCQNLAAVHCFLQRGAKIGPQTWAMTEGKPNMLLVLLKKLLEDGTTLYKKGRLKEAAHRYQYALKKCPDENTMKDYIQTFLQIKFHLYMLLSKCKRKMNEFDAAIEAADKAIILKPKSTDVYYIRARAKHESGQRESALQDITEALSLVSVNQEARKILLKLKEEINSGHKRTIQSISQESEMMNNTTGEVSEDAEGNLGRMKPSSFSTDTVDQLYGLITESRSDPQ
ncbi:protein TANC2-like isoform X2 [Limulus polyphemus]|uniref:Protein TANC2-like isoform X2 n=1 Tax=Limulus polyphemus TaxID=6850 RepID=A0ABM1T333_LIMPO|nr:protein TANC2-like isoform X2 [Limulus polyphemus]